MTRARMFQNFLKAAQTGDLQTLAEGWPQVTADEQSFALRTAASYQERAAAGWLLDQGADPTFEDSEALKWVAKHGWTDLVQRMLTAKADARHNDSLPFRWACQGGHLATAQALAPHSDFQACQYGALKWAATNGHEAVMDWLIEHAPEGAQRVFDQFLFEEAWTALDALACRVPEAQAQQWLDVLEGRHLPRTTHRLNSLKRQVELQSRPAAGSSRRRRV